MPHAEKQVRVEPAAASALLQRGYKRKEFTKAVHDHSLSKAAWVKGQTGYTMAVEANQLLVEALNAGAQSTCTAKEGHTESHTEYAKELRDLLRDRREVRDRLAAAYSRGDENLQLELTTIITTISKWLRKHKQKHWRRVEKYRVRAFEEARAGGDFREVHRLASK
eukprot:9501857-Pyramimonas_sp.AAC.1